MIARESQYDCSTGVVVLRMLNLRWYGTSPYCDEFLIEINNKYYFINLFFHETVTQKRSAMG